MIKKLKKYAGSLVKFGNGTVKIRVRNTKLYSFCELTKVPLHEIGESITHVNPVPDSERVVLIFSSIESLDVLINQLQNLKNQMEG